MLAFVYVASKQKIDLVTRDYYPRELRYEEEIQKRKNAQSLGEDISVLQTSSGLNIKIPDTLKKLEITGSFHLYRPSNKYLDIRDTLRIDSSLQFFIPATRLKKGKYQLDLELTDNNQKKYLFQKTVIIK